MKVCAEPGCPNLVDHGRCDQHQRQYKRDTDRRRPAAYARGYDHTWQRTRQRYLDQHPRCECDDCLTLPPHQRPAATDVDHRDGQGPAGPRGHDPANLRAMAHSHHSRHTAKAQPGGWHAA